MENNKKEQAKNSQRFSTLKVPPRKSNTVTDSAKFIRAAFKEPRKTLSVYGSMFYKPKESAAPNTKNTHENNSEQSKFEEALSLFQHFFNENIQVADVVDNIEGIAKASKNPYVYIMLGYTLNNREANFWKQAYDMDKQAHENFYKFADAKLLEDYESYKQSGQGERLVGEKTIQEQLKEMQQYLDNAKVCKVIDKRNLNKLMIHINNIDDKEAEQKKRVHKEQEMVERESGKFEYALQISVKLINKELTFIKALLIAVTEKNSYVYLVLASFFPGRRQKELWSLAYKTDKKSLEKFSDLFEKKKSALNNKWSNFVLGGKIDNTYIKMISSYSDYLNNRISSENFKNEAFFDSENEKPNRERIIDETIFPPSFVDCYMVYYISDTSEARALESSEPSNLFEVESLLHKSEIDAMKEAYSLFHSALEAGVKDLQPLILKMKAPITLLTLTEDGSRFQPLNDKFIEPKFVQLVDVITFSEKRIKEIELEKYVSELIETKSKQGCLEKNQPAASTDLQSEDYANIHYHKY